jgi:hypothetical protein
MALILFSLVDGLVRFKTYNLYDPGGLYHELIAACRRMLGNQQGRTTGSRPEAVNQEAPPTSSDPL